jgi:hypothetical protein
MLNRVTDPFNLHFQPLTKKITPETERYKKKERMFSSMGDAFDTKYASV